MRILSFALVAFMGCSSEKVSQDSGSQSPPIEPFANAGPDRYVEVNHELTFNPGNSVGDTFLWDFGDGSTASGENVTHQYESPG